MPQIMERARSAPEPPPAAVRWTRRQCQAIQDAGVLTGRFELVDGVIISKMGQNPLHALVVVLLSAWLSEVLGALCVRSQLPIEVADGDRETSDPEPDISVVDRPVTEFIGAHPGPIDLVLVCEVADTSLRYDLNTKAALYARTGIPEYWVIDIAGRRILVHRNPAETGYVELIAYFETDEISPIQRPDDRIRVAGLLPPKNH